MSPSEQRQLLAESTRYSSRLGVKEFDYDLAWEAVRKNAYTPPDQDTVLRYASGLIELMIDSKIEKNIPLKKSELV